MPTIRSYKQNDRIIAEGTFDEGTFRILSGQVVIQKETGTGKPVVLAELSDGELFGEMYVFDDTGFRTATVVAKTDVNVEVFKKEEIVGEVESCPRIVQSIIKTLTNRLEDTSQGYSIVSSKKTQWERILNRTAVALLLGVLVAQLIILFKPCG